MRFIIVNDTKIDAIAICIKAIQVSAMNQVSAAFMQCETFFQALFFFIRQFTGIHFHTHMTKHGGRYTRLNRNVTACNVAVTWSNVRAHQI